jgi:phage terminase small subunit
MARQLNEMQRAFALAYSKSGNATTSAISAGYSEATASVTGCQMAKKPLIAAEIVRLRAKIEKKAELSAEKVAAELAKLVFSNVQDLYANDGSLKPIHELPADVAAAISSIEMSEKGGGVSKVKTHSKLGAIELATKLLGMVREREQAQGSVQIIMAPYPEIPVVTLDGAKLSPVWE